MHTPLPSERRVAIIGLDGTPFTFLQVLLRAGEMPVFRELLQQGQMLPMTSVLPTVSCVAWTSIMTGKNPGKHGIYGFVERAPDSYGIYVNTSAHVRTQRLWDVVGQAGKRVVVVNVPNTYPPPRVNGILVAGFETPDLKKGVYPPERAARLEQLGYRVDIDAWKARQSKDHLLEDLRVTLERRTAAFIDLLDTEPWDLFIGVFMETDRIHHFLWEHMERRHPRYGEAFLDFYRQIDRALAEIRTHLRRAALFILSDHGFCTLRKEVYINTWLAKAGYLRFRRTPAESTEDIDPSSRAYSLDPGRIYINLAGREPAGCVRPGREYEEVRERIAREIVDLRDPETEEAVIERVYRREEIFAGPYLELAPDLVLLTKDGYEAKGAVNKPTLFGRQEIEGMHTTENAVLVLPASGAHQAAHVVDVMPTVLAWMGLPVPPDVDGQSLLP